MKIEKRNGELCEFDSNKIKTAIIQAMYDADEVDKNVAEEISSDIESVVSSADDIINVDEIQDLVEEELMATDFKKTAKAYIIYRHNKDINRNMVEKEYSLLSKEFLSDYKHRPDPFPTDLGHFVYLRTYSRWLPNENRRERWWETVARVVDYNCSLAPTTKLEAEKIYDNIFNLKQFTSGRSLWLGGSQASKDYPMANFNCFSRNTEFITDKGVVSFNDFEDGDVAKVLSETGGWREARITNFGKAELIKLHLKKGKATKIIETTNNHRWFVEKPNDKRKFFTKETHELLKGDKLREKKRYERQDIIPCSVGIQHGIVYGDGTYDKFKNHCKIALVGEKQELLKYFTTGSTSTIGGLNQTLVYGLPSTWKTLPNMNMNIEYLYGFLIGLFATDGSNSNNVHTISSSNKETLLRVRDICAIAGLKYGDTRISREDSPFTGEYAPCYSINLSSETITRNFLLRSKHKNNFKKNNKKIFWSVEKIETQSRIDDVWCVEEPDTNSFTLDKNILTSNCSFLVIDNIEAYHDLFYLLLIGAGVGVRVLPKDVNQLPKFRTDLNIIHEYYNPIPKNERQEYTSLNFRNKNIVEIIISDSKEAWTSGLKYYLELLTDKKFKKINTIVINYDNIRPKGEKLKTFGGHASGFQSIKIMLEKIDKIINKNININNKMKTLKPIDCADIANIIGENVVSGGVRRTSEVVLFDPNDNEIINAKTDLYKQIDGQWIINKDIIHRQMSNNTIVYEEKPTEKQLNWQIEQMRYNGEPAFQNMEAVKKRKPDAMGGNPSMPKDVLVQTTNGIFNIDELEGKKFQVKTLDGSIANAECWLSGGNKEVFEIDFGGNRKTYATAKHKFPVINGKNINNIKVSELKKGDKIPLNRNEVQGFSDKEFSYEDGLLAGIVIVYGNLYFKEDYKYNVGSFTVNNLDFEIKDFIDKKHKEITGILPKWYARKYNKKYLECNFKSTFVDYLINKLGLSYSKDDKIIPNHTWTSGDNFAMGLINGLFSTDGSVYLNKKEARVLFTSNQYKLIKDIQNLLSFYGVTSVLKNTFLIGKDYNKLNTTYSLDINGRFIHFFNNIFKLLVSRKQNKIDEIVKKLNKPNNYLYVKSISKRSKESVWDISVNHYQHVFPSQHVYTGNCMEIILKNNQVCNLTEINVMGFIENGKLNKKELLEAQRLSAKIGYRMTLVEFELHHWNQSNKDDRLIGCSLTGWQDAMNILKYSKKQQAELLKELKDVAVQSADKLADELGENKPALHTTIKPSGTISILPTVSSGIHYSHSPYYIRRVRINSDDPLVKMCEELGYSIYPEVGQDKKTCTTKVIEFPIKAPKGNTKYDISAIEQLEIYKMFMENYVEHNASITVHVRDDEWENVKKWMNENWDSVVAVSFISLNDSFYQLMPYEAINEDEYNKRIKSMKKFNPSLLQKYEKAETELDIGDDGCENNVCPIR